MRPRSPFVSLSLISKFRKGEERSYALQLVRQITLAKRRHWSRGDPVAWANESYRIAVRTLYGRLPHSRVLSESYEAIALPIVNEQLERAGVRLAVILNECLK
jgi:hypothetical protein